MGGVVLVVSNCWGGRWPILFLVLRGRWRGGWWRVMFVVDGAGVLLLMLLMARVPVVTTGGMPRRVGVYIRISVAVWFHSFCS